MGKVPARADFVRENVTRASSYFDQWLTRGMQDLHAAKRELPPVLVRFAMRVVGSDGLLVGVLTPSSDQMGRRYPVALVSELDPARAQRIAALPLACGGLYEELRKLAFEIPALSMEAIREQLRAVAPPAPGAFEQAVALVDQTLARASAAEFPQDAFPGGDAATLCYALQTFLAGVRTDRGMGPSPGVVLDCPIGVDVDLLSWLDLPHRMGVGAHLGGVFWVQDPEPRMLLCVGAAPSMLLHFLADREKTSQLLWPLTTAIDAAREQACQALGPRVQPVLGDASASIERLWAAVAGGG